MTNLRTREIIINHKLNCQLLSVLYHVLYSTVVRSCQSFGGGNLTHATISKELFLTIASCLSKLRRESIDNLLCILFRCCVTIEDNETSSTLIFPRIKLAYSMRRLLCALVPPLFLPRHEAQQWSFTYPLYYPIP